MVNLLTPRRRRKDGKLEVEPGRWVTRQRLAVLRKQAGIVPPRRLCACGVRISLHRGLSCAQAAKL